MKALTMPQPCATLAVEGAMTHWVDRVPVSPRLVGERIVIFAGRKSPLIGDIIRLYEHVVFEGGVGSGIDRDKGGSILALIRAGLERIGPRYRLPLDVALGTAMIGRSVLLTDLFPDDAEVDRRLWASPVTGAEPLDRPKHFGFAGGDRSFWEWPEVISL